MADAIPPGSAKNLVAWVVALAFIGNLIVPIVPLPTVSADSATTQDAKLPEPLMSSTAVMTSEDIFIFGGMNSSGDRKDWIQRYSPEQDRLDMMTETLPWPLIAASSVWTGEYVFIFGGGREAPSRHRDEILRYNPRNDNLKMMGATLPSERVGTTAVWTGEYAFIFGGRSGSTHLDEIVRYKPSTDTATKMSATLPDPGQSSASVWTGDRAYIFGGSADGTNYKWIAQYDPANDSLEVLPTTLPSNRSRASAVWTGEEALVFGGNTNGSKSSDPIRQVVRFLPLDQEVKISNTSLPERIHTPSAAWNGTNAYLFGGSNMTGDNDKIVTGATDKIVQYSLGPAPPANVTAVPGPEGKQVSIEWNQSDPNNNVTEYRVYRRQPDQNLSLVDAVSAGNLSYLDTNLSSNTTYIYRLTAFDGDEESDLSDPANATTFAPPSPPQDFSAKAGPGGGEITLLWDTPADTNGLDIVSYRIYRSSTEGTGSLVAELDNVTSFADTGLPSNVTRYYRVSAVTTAGEGRLSDIENATTFAPPTPPRDLVADAGPGAGNISLTWSAPSDTDGLPVTGYHIYRGSEPDSLSLATSIGNQTSYRDTDLPNNVTRYYRVTAVTDAGESQLSTSANASTFTPPDPPQDLTGRQGAAAGEIDLTWSPPSDTGGLDITGYRIYRGNATGTETFLTKVGPVTEWTDTDVPNNATRYYRVSAVNEADEGPLSDEASAATASRPGSPRDLTATPGPMPGEIFLTWNPPETDGGLAVEKYRIYRGPAVGQDQVFQELSAQEACSGQSSCSFTDPNRSLGQRYHYRVTAVNDAGEGPKSNPDAAMGTDPGLPQDPACNILVCLDTEYVEKLGDLTVRNDSLVPADQVTVQVDTGVFEAKTPSPLPDVTVDPLRVARINDKPEPAFFNRTVEVADKTIQTNYTRKGVECLPGSCTLTLGVEQIPDERKVGELWRAKVRLRVLDTEVTLQDVRLVRLTDSLN